MKDLTDFAKEQLKNDKGFINNNNYNILKVKEDYCELEGIITDTSLNPYGIAHGGFIFGLADTASGIASRSGGRVAVTSSSSIEYLRPCNGKKIKAIASCLKSGKNISVYEVYIYDENEKMVARASVSYFYIEK